ncbi:hypothetical protein [Paraburkholderia fungorum]|uniref:hypothetical protein n=1 Tax=Paraburkholderia fungorum TaxID=134537 RepID=UPI0038BCA6A5
MAQLTAAPTHAGSMTNSAPQSSSLRLRLAGAFVEDIPDGRSVFTDPSFRELIIPFSRTGEADGFSLSLGQFSFALRRRSLAMRNNSSCVGKKFVRCRLTIFQGNFTLFFERSETLTE